jgi:hypothetical protein
VSQNWAFWASLPKLTAHIASSNDLSDDARRQVRPADIEADWLEESETVHCQSSFTWDNRSSSTCYC